MFRPRRGVRRRGGGQGIGLFLLMAQIMQVGFNHIPPTTLATIGLNVAIYLKVLNPFFQKYLRPAKITNICVSTYSVWYKQDWQRLLFAAWFHLDDWHLYYNMVSFLWKGRGLEGAFGTAYFAYLIVVFSVLTNIVMVGVNIAAAELLGDQTYITTCAAGFSGVFFTLKVLTSYYTPAHMQRIFGFPVPSRWACWIELVLIQLLVPNASFTGHLAGILVGLAYCKGPLKTIMDIPVNGDLYSQSAPSYTYTAGTSHGAGRRSQSGQRSRGSTERPSASRPSYTYTANATGGSPPAMRGDYEETSGYRANDYTAGMSEQEQIDAAVRESMRSGGSSSSRTATAPPLYPDLTDEVSSPTLPPHPASNFNQPSTSNPTPTQTPPPYQRDPMPRPHNSVDQDELRRRRLARFENT
ncbi:rhomboid-related protein 4-like [Amphiura filiformis]|uniref:rhomboid-related protein 4-like n=1 Tax=Amphiura filiformis TaxID=82378 RepID=UPI003B2172E8